MLHRDTLDLIQSTAVKAAGITIHAIPGDARNVLISSPTGYEIRSVPPPLRAHQYFTLGDISEAAEKCATASMAPILYHNPKSIKLVIDDADRREVATMDLVESQQFKTLRGLETFKTMNQAQLVRLLRHDLANAISEGLLPAVRRMTFTRRSEGQADMQHGRETLGRSVENAVAGSVELPEYVVATVPVYQNAGLGKRVEIRLSLEIDAAQEAFILRPLPDAIQSAVDAAQAAIGESLRSLVGESVPVFFGCP